MRRVACLSEGIHTTSSLSKLSLSATNPGWHLYEAGSQQAITAERGLGMTFRRCNPWMLNGECPDRRRSLE